MPVAYFIDGSKKYSFKVMCTLKVCVLKSIKLQLF